MRINGQNNVQGTSPRDYKPEGAKGGQAPLQAQDTDGDSDRSGTPAAQGEDTLEISDNARKLLAGIEQPQSQDKSAPARPEAVERARKVLQSGVYNDAGVIDKTAEAILHREFSADA